MLKISNKTKITLIILILICLVIGISYFTYAFQATKITGNETSKKVSLQGQILKVLYSDGTEVLTTKQDEYFIPGSTLTKTFTIKNTGNVSVNYSINLSDITNDFVRETDLVYELKSGDEILDSNIFPKENIFLVSKQTLNVEEEKEYTLTIKYLDSKENQIIDQGKTISARITIDEDFKSIKSLKVYGNSYQDTVPTIESPAEIKSLGRHKNLFDAEKIVQDSNYPDYIYITEDKNWIRMEDSWRISKIFADFKENTQYRFTFTVKGNGIAKTSVNFRAYYTDGTNSSVCSAIGLTTTDEVIISGTSAYGKTISYIETGHHNGSYFFLKIDNAQIEEGTSSSEYNRSKYTIPITIRGKNMYNPGNELPKTIHGITINYETETGLITLNGSGGNSYKDFNNYETIKLDANKTYTHTIEKVAGTLRLDTSGVASILLDKAGNFLIQTGFIRNNINFQTKTITLTEDKIISRIRVWPYDSGSNNILTGLKLKMMLVEGTNDTKFEPYTAKTYDVYLDEPLRSVGDCTDCTDYLDINNNKIVRNVGVIENYNGETVNTTYISSTGGLDSGATILYKLDNSLIEEYDFRKVFKKSHKLGKYVDVCVGGICASNVEVEFNE